MFHSKRMLTTRDVKGGARAFLSISFFSNRLFSLRFLYYYDWTEKFITDDIMLLPYEILRWQCWHSEFDSFSQDMKKNSQINLSFEKLMTCKINLLKLNKPLKIILFNIINVTIANTILHKPSVISLFLWFCLALQFKFLLNILDQKAYYVLPKINSSFLNIYVNWQSSSLLNYLKNLHMCFT